MSRKEPNPPPVGIDRPVPPPPPPSIDRDKALREALFAAAIEVVALDWSDNDWDAVKAIERLRQAVDRIHALRDIDYAIRRP